MFTISCPNCVPYSASNLGVTTLTLCKISNHTIVFGLLGAVHIVGPRILVGWRPVAGKDVAHNTQSLAMKEFEVAERVRQTNITENLNSYTW